MVKQNSANMFEPCQVITWVQKLSLIPCLDVLIQGSIQSSLGVEREGGKEREKEKAQS